MSTVATVVAYTLKRVLELVTASGLEICLHALAHPQATAEEQAYWRGQNDVCKALAAKILTMSVEGIDSLAAERDKSVEGIDSLAAERDKYHRQAQDLEKILSLRVAKLGEYRRYIEDSGYVNAEIKFRELFPEAKEGT